MPRHYRKKSSPHRNYSKSAHFENSSINNSEIHVGDKITNITDNSKRYVGKKEDVFIFQAFSPTLLKKVGERKLGISGTISLLVGIIQLFIWMNSLTNVQIFSYLPKLPADIGMYFLWVGAFFIIIASIFLGSVVFFHERKCKKCGKDFAYIEIENPKVREVEAHDGVHLEIKRKYQCKFCGHEDIREEEKFVEKEENDIL